MSYWARTNVFMTLRGRLLKDIEVKFEALFGLISGKLQDVGFFRRADGDWIGINARFNANVEEIKPFYTEAGIKNGCWFVSSKPVRSCVKIVVLVWDDGNVLWMSSVWGPRLAQSAACPACYPADVSFMSGNCATFFRTLSSWLWLRPKSAAHIMFPHGKPLPRFNPS